MSDADDDPVEVPVVCTECGTETRVAIDDLVADDLLASQ